MQRSGKFITHHVMHSYDSSVSNYDIFNRISRKEHT